MGDFFTAFLIQKIEQYQHLNILLQIVYFRRLGCYLENRTYSDEILKIKCW